MEGTYLDCSEDSMGNITLYDNKGHDVYLQGDDAIVFSEDWNKIVAIWTRKFGKGCRKHFGPFNSYGEHMDYVISQYFN